MPGSLLWRSFSLLFSRSINRAERDTKIAGFYIPAGTVIFANFWAVHNDPTVWKNPSEFDPSRFLNADGSELLPRPEAFIPFSTGKFLGRNNFLKGFHRCSYSKNKPCGFSPIFDNAFNDFANVSSKTWNAYSAYQYIVAFILTLWEGTCFLFWRSSVMVSLWKTSRPKEASYLSIIFANYEWNVKRRL